jgi:hypothetical protein
VPVRDDRCPCGGRYEDRKVKIRMTVAGEPVEMDDVSQLACPLCGSRVYRAQILDMVECLYGRQSAER